MSLCWLVFTVGSPCRYHQFQCKSRNQCIPRSFHCDMESDCLDGSDEVGCCKYSSVHCYALTHRNQRGLWIWNNCVVLYICHWMWFSVWELKIIRLLQIIHCSFCRRFLYCHVNSCFSIVRAFLGAFAKLREATISFVLSVCLYGTTWLPLGRFSWNLIFCIFFKNMSRKFKFH